MDCAPAGLCAAGAAVGLCAAAAGVCAASGGAQPARAPPPVLPDELVEAYLKRLGLERPGLEPTLGTLNMLLSAHVDRVAYENLDIHMGRPADSLEPAHTAARIAHGGRGGYCFQLGGAFASLLASLGFEVSVHRATVRDDPAEMGAGPPVADSPEALAELNHLAVVVHFADGLWLADVGLGDGPSKAVRLADSHTHSEPPFSYKVEQQPYGWYPTPPSPLFIGRFPPFFRRSFALSGFAPRRRERANGRMGEIWGRNGRETAVAEWRWAQALYTRPAGQLWLLRPGDAAGGDHLGLRRGAPPTLDVAGVVVRQDGHGAAADGGGCARAQALRPHPHGSRARGPHDAGDLGGGADRPRRLRAVRARHQGRGGG